jgi:putative FmdB family regulatory protein
MPIYEYRCADCRRKVSVLTLRVSERVDPVCDRCGGRNLTRLMSRFALVRSEDARLDDLSDPSSVAGLDEDDPKSVARWMRRMGKELGEDAGEDFDEVVDELEAGGDDGDGGAGSGGDGDDV